MTIPGRGDLSPRHRHRSPWRLVVVVVVLAVLAGGGYVVYTRYIQDSSSPATQTVSQPLCPKVSLLSLMFAPPKNVKLAIFNASLRTGLAAEVRAEFKQRGFHVVQIGNALRVGHDVATIRYSNDEERAYRSVAAQIPGQATIKQVSGHHVLELDLGVQFQQLQSVHAAKATERRLAASQTSTATASPRPAQNCRPRH